MSGKYDSGRYQQPYRPWLDADLERREPDQLTIRLSPSRRIGLDPDLSATPVDHRRMIGKVPTKHPPHDAHGVEQFARREEPAVELAVLGANRGAEREPFAEGGSEIGDHDARRRMVFGH